MFLDGPSAPAEGGSPSPLALSVVVIVYNMRREALRTLLSLSAGYQREIDASDYEVLVVENGSTEPLDPALVTGRGANFRYLPFAPPNASPAMAVNFGLRQARGAWCGVMIDGARLASPGLLANALRAARVHPRTIVATTGWHLGPENQQQSILHGYTQRREDALLAAIGWPEGDGYRLFEIAAPALSAREGIFRLPGESNFLCLPRALLLHELGGCDERFDLPGGGLVNQDLLHRACALPDTELVLLLGEATFHQVHGGISTNPSIDAPASLGEKWQRQYQELTGQPFSPSTKTPLLFGQVPLALTTAVEWSAQLGGAADPRHNPARRTELVEFAREQDRATRAAQQRWLLLGQEALIGELSDTPEKQLSALVAEAAATDAGRSSVLAWFGRKRAPRKKKTLLFCVDYRGMQGAHLKTWHYFQHARHSDVWEPRVFFPLESVWDDENPWRDERARAVPEYLPGDADALLIEGRHAWLRLPAAQRENWPAPVICTVQGFRHADPHRSYAEFLRCRAVRICVSPEVRAAIVATGRVRGPAFVIPNAVDLSSDGGGATPRETELFIAGLKNPELAAALEAALTGRGWRIRVIAGRLPRRAFLEELRQAKAALFLPRPSEGFYLPALEAMALGTPVICPDVIGNRSFCQDRINCFRPAYAMEDLLAACTALQQQTTAERERMLLKAQETAALHSLDRERDRFLRILEHLPALWKIASAVPVNPQTPGQPAQG